MRDYKLIRSERKNAMLSIRDGGLEVRAPLNMPKSEIDKFVVSRENWIVDRLIKFNEQMILRENFSLDYGSFVKYRGGSFPIEAIDGGDIGFNGKAFYMPPDLLPDQIKGNCIQIYRTLAKEYLPKRTSIYAKQMSVKPSILKICNAKARWGSCNSNGDITFVWRLMMADDEVIDYVVVHELAHLVEMNHSEKYWDVVERVLPDYRERKARLKELHNCLQFENW